MRAARALLPLKDDKRAQRELLRRMIDEGLAAKDVAALVAKARFGKAAVEPIAMQVRGKGKAEVRTTARGKLRVVVEAEDRTALDAIWKALRRELGS